MQSLIVEGGAPIKGEVTVSGNKNAVLPMMAAALLSDEKVILHNVPAIVDVLVTLEIFDHTGVDYEFSNNTLVIDARKIKNSIIPREICSRIRTSIMFAGPLTLRCGKCEIFPPGGDIIGRRRLDGHVYGLKSLGIDIELDHRFIFKVEKRLIGRELFLDEASVTATEQLMTAAVTAEGITTIRNAASEPHVNDLAKLLNKMGARISGLNSNTLIIEGVEKLHGAEHTVVSDHTEAGSFIALGAACGGELTIKNTVPRHYWMTRRVFERLGVKLELHQNEIFLPGNQEMKIQKDFGGHCPVIADGPWPQFPSDLMSVSIVAATQAEGTILFFEKMFESRLYFVDRLISMGAGAIVCDPHRVVINGRSQLRGVEMSSPDIRAGMALLIAALCADGQSRINSANIIYRGYENIVNKLLGINAKVQAVES
ncbi:UDP-N-acetylglucosamine 1-carboxyvinyltransferase [Lentisphaerota bacterium ZTH]|nr:UDP-N-acetylglucosamine 1-carboxyvinyltransferase [Lentisphaerota bacterium]WET07271.1 UDP-N-acetylglucosamine 1-carboxyvinyltransferase [Lentisphaerota bacterium ZTH]